MDEKYLEKEISNVVGSCILWFVAILIAAVAMFIWKTKIALFILAVTVIFFILSIIGLCFACFKLKKILKDEKLIGQEKSLYEVLRDIRIDNNERLYDMAVSIGVSSADLSQIEKGHQENHMEVTNALAKIAIVYNLDNKEIDTLWRSYLATYGENEEQNRWKPIK